MKHLFDMTNRFRILKGGKISLVVGAMMIGSFINVSNAAEKKIETHLTAEQVFDNNENDSFIVTKDGRIDSSPRAINIINGMGSDHKLENYGTLQVIGSSWSVINSNSTIEGIINNFGTISNKDVVEFGQGININTMYGGKIYNMQNGIIEANSSVSGEGSYIVISALHINEMSNSSTIDNSGTIESSAKDNEAYVTGIYVKSNFNGSSITNSGNITTTATSTGEWADANAYGIYVYVMKNNSSITNSGNITTTATSTGEWADADTLLIL